MLNYKVGLSTLGAIAILYGCNTPAPPANAEQQPEPATATESMTPEAQPV
jgi:hypothetical protein